MGTDGTQHVVVVPVKTPGIGKTRLVGVPSDQRAALARAFAIDTVTACLATPGVARVLVTTDDSAFGATFAALGAETCTDAGDGLNEALRAAAAEAARRWPDLRPVALCADLPALRPDDLARALATVTGGAAYVADADGTGTTLYTAPYDAFSPRFGLDSAAAHAAVGAHPVPGELAGLRRDVDDLASLRAAFALGVGPATAATIEAGDRLAPDDTNNDDNDTDDNDGPPSR